MNCPQCGTEAAEGSNFCYACGNALAAAPALDSGRTPWGSTDIVKVIGLIIVGGVVIVGPALVAAILIAGEDRADKDAGALAITTGANFLWQISTLLFTLRFSVWKYKTSLSELGYRRPKRGTFWLPPLLVFGSWAVLAIYFAIVTSIGGPHLGDQEQLPDEAFDSLTVLPFVGLVSLVGAPVSEEAFFRGFLFQSLRGRWGMLAALFASGALFGAVHVLPVLIIPFAIIGVLFALGYVYSDSLWVPMAAHFLFNGISFIISIIAVSS